MPSTHAAASSGRSRLAASVEPRFAATLRAIFSVIAAGRAAALIGAGDARAVVRAVPAGRVQDPGPAP